MIQIRAVIGLILTALAAAAYAGPWPEIRTSDVELFYRIYDGAAGKPSAAVLQRDYIGGGSEGVRQFVPQRILSGEALAAAIEKQPQIYEQARACSAALPAVKARLAVALSKLSQLDSDATFPPVTVLIGRDNSGGTTGKSGVLIGLEVVCRSNWLQPNLEDRLLHLIAHEYGHVEQPDDDSQHPTLLTQAMVEGGAELVAELISGQVSNIHLQRWTRGHEREIDERFLTQKDGTDLSAWLYNGAGTPDKPGDLGYWVGFRIVKAYYAQAHDKRAALAAILALKDPQAILVQSGFKPGQID
jgi:hypothetical protein